MEYQSVFEFPEIIGNGRKTIKMQSDGCGFSENIGFYQIQFPLQLCQQIMK